MGDFLWRRQGGVPECGRVPLGRSSVGRGHARGETLVRRMHQDTSEKQDENTRHPPTAVHQGCRYGRHPQQRELGTSRNIKRYST